MSHSNVTRSDLCHILTSQGQTCVACKHHRVRLVSHANVTRSDLCHILTSQGQTCVACKRHKVRLVSHSNVTGSDLCHMALLHFGTLYFFCHPTNPSLQFFLARIIIKHNVTFLDLILTLAISNFQLILHKTRW